MPNWVFSPKFSVDALASWTERQIEIFSNAGRSLHCVRIKNPGQGVDWTAKAIWAHVQRIRAVFEAKRLEPPIVYVRGHDFSGGGCIGRNCMGP